MYKITIEAINDVFFGVKVSPLHLNLSGYAECCFYLLIMVFNIFHVPLMLLFFAPIICYSKIVLSVLVWMLACFCLIYICFLPFLICVGCTVHTSCSSFYMHYVSHV